MRWEALFGDLEAQWSAQRAQQLEAEIAEAVEWERGQMLLVDRLRAGVGAQVQITLQDGGQLHLLVQRVGADWLSGRTGARSVILPVRAITSIEGLSARALPETSHTRRLLGMGSPLRALARSRETVIVTGVGGELGRGVIAHVGADHLDVAVKSEGAAPGRSRRIRTIALASVVLVRSS
ncbi:MAG: hypothetical protein ACTHWO_07565 [Nesterenkonia sp.]